MVTDGVRRVDTVRIVDVSANFRFVVRKFAAQVRWVVPSRILELSRIWY
jgi:hypothetical protein